MSAADAEILAVGSELLTSSKIDTNSLWLTGQLNSLGVEVTGKSVIGDDRLRLTNAVRGAMSRARIVLICGGLGPTEDDLTRDAVAAALGRPLHFREDVFEVIASRFRRMKRAMADNNKRQAMVIEGGEVLPNDLGTAPGQWIAHENGVMALVPGPPREMKAMFEAHCLPRLRNILPPLQIRTRFYRVACKGESEVDAIIAPAYTQFENPTTTILFGVADIQVHLRARAETADDAEQLLQTLGTRIEELLGDSLYTSSGETIETVIGKLLLNAGKTVGFAESLTGGVVAGRVTSVPGSSQYFRGGVVVYTDEAKQELLNIPAQLLAEHTSVSEPVAAALAENVRSRLGADYGVSLTGYAGPDGGDERNPVGTVFIGIAGPDGTSVRRWFFAGDRERIRALASMYALDMLRRALLV